jgi:NAD(P)-dependent dehydrogenase (short-subunit alcohol dehydrogenase family)
MSSTIDHGQRLAGKVAVITGAAKGIGLATAKLFLAQGAKVVLSDLDLTQIRALAADLAAKGGEAIGVACDVRREDDISALVATAVTRFGRLDILVANAGIIPEAFLEQATAQLWDDTMAVDARGMFLSAKYAAAEMVRAGSGAIVFLSSVSAHVGQLGQVVYGPAKFVASGLTKHLAVELAPKGVRVNAVAPGTIATPAVAAMAPEGIAQGVAKHPIGRIGQAEEVAWAILFLAQ